MKKITYKEATHAHSPTWRTPKYGNLLSDTFQGEVSQDEDGTWVAWLINLSVTGEGKFEFSLKSKLSATRKVNKWLRETGYR